MTIIENEYDGHWYWGERQSKHGSFASYEVDQQSREGQRNLIVRYYGDFKSNYFTGEGGQIHFGQSRRKLQQFNMLGVMRHGWAPSLMG